MKVKDIVSLMECAYIVNDVDLDGEPRTLYSSGLGELPDNISSMEVESIDQGKSEIIINV